MFTLQRLRTAIFLGVSFLAFTGVTMSEDQVACTYIRDLVVENPTNTISYYDVRAAELYRMGRLRGQAEVLIPQLERIIDLYDDNFASRTMITLGRWRSACSVQ